MNIFGRVISYIALALHQGRTGKKIDNSDLKILEPSKID